MSTLLEASLQVHLLLTLIHPLQTFLGVLLQIGLCFSVHYTHFVNTVCPILPEVPEQKVYFLFRGHWWSVLCVGDTTGPGWLGFRSLHSATLVD